MASDFTGGLFDPQGPAYGKLATKNERQRQAMINQGMANINAIFGGGTADFYSMANASGNKFGQDWRSRTEPYYSLTGKGFVPYNAPHAVGSQGTMFTPIEGGDITQYQRASVPTGGAAGSIAHVEQGKYGQAIASTLTGGLFDLIGSFFGGDKPSPLDIEKKMYQRGQLLNKTSATYEGFQPDFYNQRAQDYINYALPQEGAQYNTNLKALTYNLANRGLSSSSVANAQMSDLARTDIQAKQSLADQAIGQANQLRNQVEAAKSGAIAQLYQSGDPNLAASGAIQQFASLNQPSVFAPIGNLFGQLASSYYTNQLLNSYKNQGGGVPSYGSQYYDLSAALPQQ